MRLAKRWAASLLNWLVACAASIKRNILRTFDTGDYIIVLNAEKVAVTGNKRSDKIYYHHTGFVGGIKQATFEEMIARHPERVIEIAVKGMLPKGPLGRAMYRKLKVYAGTEHNHAAQQPQVLDI
ncbi:50S ribosomal protein L13 [Budvicia aquatica]|uniref:Large ribosomal subunit protein uL13 n=1 Tax=Budvicia aquatica TaxID=82979 RepID=A0A484ZAT2_9GAMM|nr:50S ribosomal protein L13 [Budvicia aquatica]